MRVGCRISPVNVICIVLFGILTFNTKVKNTSEKTSECNLTKHKSIKDIETVDVGSE